MSEKYWHIVYSKSKDSCEHKSWITMSPLRKEYVSEKYERYKLYVTEHCENCGENRERFLGLINEGIIS